VIHSVGPHDDSYDNASRRRQAAEDEPVYYHGTSKAPGWKPSFITPAAQRPGSKVTFPSDTSPEHAYATTNRQ
jgi:hypothetical protein